MIAQEKVVEIGGFPGEVVGLFQDLRDFNQQTPRGLAQKAIFQRISRAAVPATGIGCEDQDTLGSHICIIQVNTAEKQSLEGNSAD